MSEFEQIKKDHPPSYRGILQSYSYDDVITSWPFWTSIFAAVTVIFFTKFSHKSYYEILCYLVNQVASIFPNLLGFNLGGYALIVGFGNSELIQSMTRKLKDKKISIFQKLSGIFAFAILLQITAYTTAFSINLFDQFKFEVVNEAAAQLVNLSFLGLISFLGFWGILILPNIVSNVFTFGQMHHSYLTVKRLETEKKRRSEAENRKRQASQ